MDEGTGAGAQRAYARLAGWMYLANYAFAVTGAAVPSSLRGSGTYAEKAARAVELRWRAAWSRGS
jgi:hypothetical protein